jgi:mono/diheme cytochrome c family protein
MKFKRARLLPLVIFCLICLPGLSIAQGNHDGNHCAVQKSPFRMSMDSGKVIYARQCASCHGADGLGSTNICPPLDAVVINGDKTNLIQIVIEGLKANETKNGKTYSRAMPPGPDLKDQEVADVLTYIRNSFGNKASAVRAAVVKSVRSQLK